ncbi:MAG TPA: lipoprotein-releasing ABC transporter permease subunit [Steroidobacteraceae bacterium]|nr:lipoprotein-releasing ABC transporter permease subunit [Steroidobacteraceae bacterium]
MFYPLPLAIGLRYVRSRKRSYFVSFITWSSLAGLALGVAALITMLSIMNGFEAELRSRLVSLAAHASVTAEGLGPDEWPSVVNRVRAIPEVIGAAPYVEAEAMLGNDTQLEPAILRGIDPARETSVSTIARTLLDGSLASLAPGSDAVVLGRGLAAELGVGVGDRVTVMIPTADEAGEVTPRIRQFTVGGVFEAGLQDHDSVLALAHIDDVAALRGTRDLTGVRVKYTDLMRAPQSSARVAGVLGARFKVTDWTEQNAAYFRAVNIEKTMMALIMLLIVAVAAFNIVASLVMVVTDKRTDIAMLRTLGLTPREVLQVFLTQGTVIGWLGTAIGVALGTLLAYNVGSVVEWLQRAFRFQIMDAEVYYITRIPSDPHVFDIAWIAAAAFALTLLATIYPALRAARTQPAEALRYE